MLNQMHRAAWLQPAQLHIVGGLLCQHRSQWCCIMPCLFCFSFFVPQQSLARLTAQQERELVQLIC